MGENNECAVSDIWSSILFSNTLEVMDDQSSSSCTPYRPQYIRPFSYDTYRPYLTNESLHVCTESLCSESGSDAFSSSLQQLPPLDYDFFHDTRHYDHPDKQCRDNNMKTKYVHGTPRGITHPSRYLPPPLPSVARMQSHRRDGRFILEAVSLPSSKCFRAHRQNGRLLLRLVEEEEDEEEGDITEEEQEKELNHGGGGEGENGSQVIVEIEARESAPPASIGGLGDCSESCNHPLWKGKAMMLSPTTQQSKTCTDIVLHCKESRTSYLSWESHYIATS